MTARICAVFYTALHFRMTQDAIVADGSGFKKCLGGSHGLPGQAFCSGQLLDLTFALDGTLGKECSLSGPNLEVSGAQLIGKLQGEGAGNLH